MVEFYQSCEGVNLWLNLILTVLISPLLLMAKIVWDRCNKRRDNTIIMKNKFKLENISEKLAKFYWPLYIRLVKNYSIWVKLLEGTYSANLEQNSDEGENSPVQDIHTDRMDTGCRIHIHPNTDGGVCLYTNGEANQPGLINNYHDGITKYYKTKLIESYSEINKLIIDNIHISEPNTQLGKLLIVYMKFIISMSAWIETNQPMNMQQFKLKYPHRLLPLIEGKLFILQKQYNSLLHNYYYSV